tara:strand:- start:320 stop:667 length:348 start_codon:yes stop_codon:yes gene_type:complete
MAIDFITTCILVSSFSFFGYVLSYFISPHMKSEFKRFNLEKLGLIIILFQFLGASGLLVGLVFHPVLIISSLGLFLQMLLGLIVRIKLKDSLWISLPAFFFMILNGYIFLNTINY